MNRPLNVALVGFFTIALASIVSLTITARTATLTRYSLALQQDHQSYLLAVQSNARTFDQYDFEALMDCLQSAPASFRASQGQAVACMNSLR